MKKDLRVMNDTDKCVEMIGNRFDLVLVASQRVREINRGAVPKLKTSSRPSVAALEEIELGLVGREYLKKIK
jgi:DNA-directed RNA polymerase subunit omega